MSKYVNYNGELKLSEDGLLMADNRSFCYGDGFFETIRCLSSKPLFFDQHYLRIKHSLKALKIELPREFSQSFFEQEIFRLLQRSRLYKGVRVRIAFFRKSGGLYTPKNNTLEYLITAAELPDEIYTLNQQALKVGVFTQLFKAQNFLSRIKSSNAQLYVMAGLWKQESGFDDCFICNEEGLIVEALSSNLFIVKDNTLLTPNIKSGCVAGTMRNTILNIAEANDIKVYFNNGLRANEILDADEIFLTNAIQGIQSVTAFRSRRYFHTMAKFLLDQLNGNIKMSDSSI